jgi:hypothetical protein
MTRIWKAPHSGTRGNDCGVRHVWRTASLLPQEDIRVRVAFFAFIFSSIAELRSCLNYYMQRTHPSSRVPAKELARQLGPDWRTQRSWEVERWFERLPMYLLEEPKRQKVVAALSKTLKLLETGKLKANLAKWLAYRRGDGTVLTEPVMCDTKTRI